MQTPGQGTVIRRAVPTDAERIARIWYTGWFDGHDGRVPRELYAYRGEDSYPERVASRLEHTWVAERDAEVVGFVVVVGDEVEQVYVDAAAGGTGVAAALLARAERVVADAGHERAWLAVVAGNDRARAFYARAGWEDAGEFPYEAETSDGTITVPCRRYEKRVRAAR